ncbi:hypothetical protein ABZ960_01100 [Streptomyces pseudovenezuelae]|uniref:hypothetical protein n=1 Tax=Streptomyces pseudovenezuelae TaxID=67350 RepID=UPI0034A408FA
MTSEAASQPNVMPGFLLARHGFACIAVGITTSCVRFMVEGCAVASVLGMLEEREAAAQLRAEGLREEVARLAAVLEAAEIELDRRVIAREELLEALAVAAAESTAVTTTEAEEKRRRRSRRCRARWCRPGGKDCR